MLRNLKLEKYRSFDSYELSNLSRVNLLVGKNDCGKTSILEAIHFLVSRGDPEVLARSAERRGEGADVAPRSAAPSLAEAGSRPRRTGPSIARAGVLLGFGGTGRRGRVLLGSHGDGMHRLLALSLALIQAADGVLLIDEIDTGLHWTVMDDMWRLVVETARKSSVQVFATTHSYDCIRGLSSLVESRSDLAGEVSIHKVERSLRKAVDLDAEDVQVAVEQNIEVR